MLCNRYRIPVMPGVMTIKEIQEALELGRTLSSCSLAICMIRR